MTSQDILWMQRFKHFQQAYVHRQIVEAVCESYYEEFGQLLIRLKPKVHEGTE